MWVAIKLITNTGVPHFLGCVVGPFNDETYAQKYAEAASKFSLGYERWEVKKLLLPTNVI